MAGSQVDSIDFMAAKLARLSNRDDVKAALVLDRTTGAVLTATGDFASLLPATVNHIESSSSTVEDSLAADVVPATLSDTAASDGQRFAGTIWPFIGLAGSMIQDIDSEDELKLLRLRSKKQEIVVVPDVKYILIVVHETPSV